MGARCRSCGGCFTTHVVLTAGRAQYPGEGDSMKLIEVAQLAQDAFWKVVAESYPEITTGDLEPLAVINFNGACDAVIRAWLNANQAVTWLRVNPYGCAFRIDEDDCLAAAPINLDGTIDENHIDYPSPHDGVEDAVLKADAIIERLLRDPLDPQSVTVAAYLANPDAFQGDAGDALPIVCEECHIRFGDQCKHF